MHISDEGLALIMHFEGASLAPYICPAGKPTIGYGHVIRSDEQDFADGITLEEAKTLLKNDISGCERVVTRLVWIRLNQGQFDALVSLVYNIGWKAFEKSSLLRFLNQNSPERAALEFDKWVYAGGRKMPGLVRRRAAERGLFVKNATFTKL